MTQTNTLIGEKYTAQEIEKETVKYNQEEAHNNISDSLARQKQKEKRFKHE